MCCSRAPEDHRGRWPGPGDGAGVDVAVGLGAGVGGGVGDGRGVGVGEAIPVGVADGVAVGVADGVVDGEGEPDADGVAAGLDVCAPAMVPSWGRLGVTLRGGAEVGAVPRAATSRAMATAATPP
ncbi:MAG: hypothetical protein WB802_02185 [Candidatus Dormiibacterota bacterium]